MESTSVRESGYVTDSEEIEKQFLADLEKAKALSMETAALEKFRHMAPAAASNTGDNPTRSRITQSNSCSTIDQGNGEKGSILITSSYYLLVLKTSKNLKALVNFEFSFCIAQHIRVVIN